MSIEIKRAIRSKFYIFFVLLNILCIILGYILLVTIDKVQTVTFQDMFESVYTVYTQFGTLLFSTVIIMQFYVDYKEKNIAFYKTLGFSGHRYFFTKVSMVLIATIIGSFISSTIICLLYGELYLLPIVFLKIESVMIYYTVTISAISFIFSNFLTAFFMNVFLWIAGIVISAGSSFMQYFAYYDASAVDYQYLIAYLDGDVITSELLQHIAGNYVYDVVVFGLCFAVICFFQKRWIKNGI